MTYDPRDDSLAGPLPDSPFPLLARWLDEGRERSGQRNPDAMVVATIGDDGRPDARTVLCRGLDTEAGAVTFFTNRRSAKGRQLGARPVATAVLHWDALARQVRVTGVVVPSPDEESDAYFARRPRASQIAAWASAQSEPLASRAELEARLAETAARFGGQEAGDPVPRPPHWGGYRIVAERVELWVGSEARAHDRVLWRRTLGDDAGDASGAGPWSHGRLQP